MYSEAGVRRIPPGFVTRDLGEVSAEGGVGQPEWLAFCKANHIDRRPQALAETASWTGFTTISPQPGGIASECAAVLEGPLTLRR